jgi:hypothetical protein
MVDWLAAAALAAGATGAGLLALLPLLPARQPGAWALRLGAAYLVGQGILAGLLLLSMQLGLPWRSTLTLLALSLLAAALLPLVARALPRDRHDVMEGTAARGPGLTPLAWSIVVGLLLLICLRQALLLRHLAFDQLLAWDSWMNWLPKARTWYELGHYVEFVEPGSWLAAQEPVHTLGNARASTYPELIPLILLAGLVTQGGDVNAATFLGWWLAPLAIAACVFGHLRIRGTSLLTATAAAYAVQSLPLVNTHTLLAGYADPWLAAYACLGAIALDRFQRERGAKALVLLGIAALLCALSKSPGRAVAVLLLAPLLLSLPRRFLVPALASCALVLVAVMGAVFALGWEIDAGGLLLSATELRLPGIDSFELRYQPLHQVLPRYLWELDLWHTTWALLLALTLVALRHARVGPQPWLVLVFLFSLLAALFAIFSLTDYYDRAANGVTINRSLMSAAPTALLVIAMIYHAVTREARPIERHDT